MSRTSNAALLILVALAPLATAAAPPTDWYAYAKKSQARHAYGVYFGGKKVGWIVEEIKLGEHAGRRVLESSSDERTETAFDGEKSVKEERSTTRYALAGDGLIVSYDSYRKEDGKVKRRKAERVGDKLRITTKVGNNKVTRSVPMPKDTLASSFDLESWLQGDRKAGDKITKFGVSWDENNIESKQHYLFREKKKILYAGKLLDVCRVQITIEGGKMEAQVMPDSRTVTAEMGKIVSIRLDKEEDAKKLTGKAVDLMDLTSIYVQKRLGSASRVESLTLELTGLDDFKVPASHRQIVTPGKEKAVVELRRDFRVDKGVELTKQERKRFLQNTPRFQIAQPAVVAQAKEIVGDETDALAKARLIEKWVYAKLEKSYSANADSALEILHHKAGDCTEHSLIFVALCRASGVPAREVGGLAYIDGKKPLFGWHAWAKIHDGHQWVSVDPTWNQVYVDGTHLELSEGDRDLTWTNIIGTLKMKVVDVKSRK
jgi:Transglutaminase-like superfamily